MMHKGLQFTVLLALQSLLIASVFGVETTPSEDVDTKKYSYLCLESNQDLCLGISPGDGEPFFDPNAVFWLQVKSRSGGEASRSDYKKTRWDIGFGQGKLALSRFSDLCAVKEGQTTRAGLFPCNTTFPQTYTPNKNYGKWKLGGFKNDPDGAGTLELAGGASQCLTVMTCNSILGEDYCNKDSEEIAWDAKTNKPKDLRRGAYVRLRPCYNNGGVAQYKGVQVWRQQLDCAIGCTPGLQNDNKCDPECNNAACDFDNDRCRFSPTKSPTVVRTDSPTTTSPTKRPTTAAPTTLSPSTRAKVPTFSPTVMPSYAPTTSPTVKCPENGTLEYCGRFGIKSCTKSAIVTERCMWCLDRCLPKSDDPRVCQIPDLFDHCKAQCPTEAQRRRCRPKMARRACLLKKSNCIFCPNLTGARCFPGKDKRVCERPDLYDHCGTASPTPLRCPERANVYKCLQSVTSGQCPKGPCVWCGASADSYPCRPRSPLGLGICKEPGNPIFSVFPHCPQLMPLPTKSPSTSKPSLSPTSKPTKSPSTSKPSASPTQKPSPRP